LRSHFRDNLGQKQNAFHNVYYANQISGIFTTLSRSPIGQRLPTLWPTPALPLARVPVAGALGLGLGAALYRKAAHPLASGAGSPDLIIRPDKSKRVLGITVYGCEA